MLKSPGKKLAHPRRRPNRRYHQPLTAGNSAWPPIGDADDVASGIADLHALGFSGIAMGLVNYTRDFPYFRDEVMPRLARLGLRAASSST